MVDSHKYPILLRLHQRLGSDRSGWVGIAYLTFGEYFGIFLGNAHPTSFTEVITDTSPILKCDPISP